jgi:hypothetical protein
MTHVALRVLLVVLGGLALAAGPSQAQTAAPADAASRDCSRWPASVYDETTSSCVCPQSMWWNLRGDACLPREHAAGEFCVTVWPGSSPFLIAGGGYRCVCAPPLLWDAQATACRPPAPMGEVDCSTEWPGTLPVLSPSGTEFECRCPGGKRWDEANRSCVGGAPVVPAMRGYYGDGTAPGTAVPGPPAYAAPGPAAGAPPGYPAPGTAPGYAAPDAAPVPAPVIPGAGAGAASNPKCDALLAEIRGRAQAGQSAESDALGMKAAVAGCDPAAISDAARAKPVR